MNTGVNLYHNNSPKLATTSTGVDVTGTVTAETSASGVQPLLKLYQANNTSGNKWGIDFSRTTGSASDDVVSKIYANREGGDATGLTFDVTESGGTTSEAMRISSGGNVGIGNTSSGYIFTAGETRLSVGDGAEHAGIQVLSGTNKWGGLEFADDTTNANAQGLIAYYHPDNYMQFKTNGSERLRIDASGNLTLNPNSSGATYLNLNTGATDDGHIIIQRNGSNKYQITSGTTNALQFYNYTAGGESMRIDSSGNVLVGKTTGAFATTGLKIQNNGAIEATNAREGVLALNRTGSDGYIQSVYKNG